MECHTKMGLYITSAKAIRKAVQNLTGSSECTIFMLEISASQLVYFSNGNSWAMTSFHYQPTLYDHMLQGFIQDFFAGGGRNGCARIARETFLTTPTMS